MSERWDGAEFWWVRFYSLVIVEPLQSFEPE